MVIMLTLNESINTIRLKLFLVHRQLVQFLILQCCFHFPNLQLYCGIVRYFGTLLQCIYKKINLPTICRNESTCPALHREYIPITQARKNLCQCEDFNDNRINIVKGSVNVLFSFLPLPVFPRLCFLLVEFGVHLLTVMYHSAQDKLFDTASECMVELRLLC